MQKIFDTAFDMENPDSDNCFVTQGLITSFVQQFNDRQKMNSVDDDDKFNNADEDDDIILNEASDDENKAG